MEEYLNKGIKEIITDFPAVAAILLEEYSIGCATCGEGTCLFKDIVQIHNLPEEQKRELILKITKVIYPDSDIEIPEVEQKIKQVKVTEIKYSPPVKRLMDEHVLIKRLIALIPKLTENLDLESESDRQLVLDSLDFIRSYADKFHHAKEEDTVVTHRL